MNCLQFKRGFNWGLDCKGVLISQANKSQQKQKQNYDLDANTQNDA